MSKTPKSPEPIKAKYRTQAPTITPMAQALKVVESPYTSKAFIEMKLKRIALAKNTVTPLLTSNVLIPKLFAVIREIGENVIITY